MSEAVSRLANSVETLLLQRTVSTLTSDPEILVATGLNKALIFDCFAFTAHAESPNGIPRGRLYKDSKGMAVGHGFNWAQRDMSVSMADRILLEFICLIGQTFQAGVPGWQGMPDEIKRILICIAYQNGAYNVINDWPDLIAAARNHDLEGVKDAAYDSKWAREDTPGRASQLLSL